MRIEHVALWTTDLERLRSFYEQHLGARAGACYTNPRTMFRSYFLTFGAGARLELMQRPDVGGQSGQSGQEIAGYAHLALSVGSIEQVDRLTERLRAAGCPLISGPRRTGDGYYESVILDPDGNRIEITV